jgi:hypothetical protein
MRPSGERVPSTKVVMCTPLASTRSAAATLALRVGCVAAAVHGDELALLEAGAQDGQLHQRALHEGRGAPRNQRDQRGRVEIRDVVRHEDARPVSGHVLQTFHLEAHPGHAATAGEHEARALVERQHVARQPAPGDKQKRRGNPGDDHRGHEDE